MIGAIDAFSEIFGSIPEGDISWNVRVAKSAVKAGFGVVLIYPNDKVTACTLTAAQAQKADVVAQDAAKAAGNLGWEKVKHACGVAHVITDEKDLNKVGPKRLLEDGANIALAPGVGTKRIAVVDLDTSKQVESFRARWSENSNEPVELTVSSPGVYKDTWVHKDGGHVWFEVDEDVELPDRKGRFTWCDCHEFKPHIPDPENAGRLKTCPYAFAFYWASGYVLVPPSVRSEGAYRLMGSAVALPDWLAEMARASVAGRPSEAGSGALGRFEDDPIDEWSREITWGDILTGDGFTPAGQDNCGCPTYTRPGDATHSKSVTAHEPGCSLSWPDVSTGHLPMHIWSDALGGGRTLSKLSWIAEARFGGNVRDAMNYLGLRKLRDMPDIGLDLEVYESPKAQTPETLGTNSDASTGERPRSAFQQWTASEDYRERLSDEILRQFVRKNATDYLREMEVKESWLPPTEEDDFSLRLLNPSPGVKYAIEDVLPMNANAMISAQYKSGKTTFILECVRALADGGQFLGRYDVNTSGRVALWNYELDGVMMDEWMRDTEMEHPENVRLLNLRGRRVPMDTKYGQEWTIDWLRRREIRTWIIDPAVRAMIGFGDENDNGAVTVFTDMLDQIKEKAGVSELIIAHHTGRAEMAVGEERARGATRWDDWPDSRWILTKMTGSDTRFIRMTGRGKDLPERALTYDAPQRRVALVGGGDPLASADRRTIEMESIKSQLLAYITENPGLSKNRVMEGIGNTSNRATGPALSALEAERKIYTEDGPNRSKLHYAGNRPSAALEAGPTSG
jgi:hypothetical protein